MESQMCYMKMTIISIGVLYYYYKKLSRRRTRRMWVRPMFLEAARRSQGITSNLMVEMKLSDKDKYKNYFRMTEDQFDFLLRLVRPSIQKLDVVRNSISAETRLAATLRFLASGDSMVSISYQFRIGKSTTSEIIRETCNILWDKLKDIVMVRPNKENWLDIATNFELKWNFPHCLGAVDGKHIVIQAPSHSGSKFYNYKGTHSIVLMAVCNANYEFVLVDIGAQGRQSDGGIFKFSQMGFAFEEGLLDIPQASELFPGGPVLPYVLVADDAFQLTNYLLKPYPGRNLNNNFSRRIFNYRLSRARRSIENTFGILASCWRIFRKPIIASLETTTAIVKSCVCLHNFLLQQDRSEPDNRRQYCYPGFADAEAQDGTVILGAWRNEANAGAFRDLSNGQNTYSRAASDIRDDFAEYFMTDGSVDFQWPRAIQ